MISTLPSRREESAQVCIVGSGAAGSVFAYELASAGMDVIVLEEGDELTRHDFNQREGELVPRIYADSGARATHDAAIPILQGRCVGGSTVINHGICFRTPERILDEWKRDFGVGDLSMGDLEPHFRKTEEMIGARKVSSSEINANNQIFKRGCEKLGYRGDAMTLNMLPCGACGPCNLGCPEGKKGSTAINYLPQAVARGARILRNCRVDKIEVSGGRAVAVKADSVRVNASIIIVAAGALNSPAILLRSGLATALPALGSSVSLHPLIPLLIFSDDTLCSMRGFPHSYYCDAFFNETDDFLFEGVFVSMGIFGSGMGGYGRQHREFMKSYPRLGLTYIQLRDRSRGRVSLRNGHPAVRYTMNAGDRERVRKGLKILTRICLEGGASRIATTHVKPVVINSPDDIMKLDHATFRPNDLTVFSAHPQGGCPMGNDPRRSVVDSRAAVHGIKGLYVCDASVFPSPVGINPMISIMAIASLTAERMIESKQPRTMPME
jgi:choline dehydrogenase-like flavoprotein